MVKMFWNVPLLIPNLTVWARNAFYKTCPWKRNLNLQSESIRGKSIFITFVPFYVYSSCENRFKCCNSACIVCHNFSMITESWLILIIVRFCCFMFIEISVMFNVSLMLMFLFLVVFFLSPNSNQSKLCRNQQQFISMDAFSYMS